MFDYDLNGNNCYLTELYINQITDEGFYCIPFGGVYSGEEYKPGLQIMCVFLYFIMPI